jgi:hypothetical protein
MKPSTSWHQHQFHNLAGTQSLRYAPPTNRHLLTTRKLLSKSMEQGPRDIEIEIIDVAA